MADQAALLREKMKQMDHMCKSVAVVSGKGGVGKSSFAMNFALALADRKQKVLVIDMDIGMGNIHILLGKPAEYNLKNYLDGTTGLKEILVDGPLGIRYISGGSGLTGIMEWSDKSFQRLIHAFEAFQAIYDVILFDMGAGATNETLELLMSIEDIIVITTPEPTAITDAYSIMKFICLKDPDKKISLLCNRSERLEEGAETAARLQAAMKKFLDKEVLHIGVFLEEQSVKNSVKMQEPYFLAFPDSKAAKEVSAIAEMYLSGETRTPEQNISFAEKLKNLFRRGRVKPI